MKIKLEDLTTHINNYSRQPETIKLTIGDSIDNNRTLSVNQLIRFLTRKNASKNQRAVGKFLSSTYNSLKPDLKRKRFFNSRTDAYDINEFSRSLDDLCYSSIVWGV